MFDSIDPRLFWPLFMLAWLLAGFVVAYWFGKFIDGRNPMNRTRRLMNGRKRMASDWRKPDHLPEDWH